MPRTIAFLIFDGAEELDFAGPWEIFTMVGELHPGETRCYTASEMGGIVTCAKGLRVAADYTFAQAPPADVIIIPGGRGTRRERDNPAMLETLHRLRSTAAITASVCTGALVLERAGLLDGRRAITHRVGIPILRSNPRVTVVEGARYVDEGEIVTAAGVSAGIDMALHLVRRLWGEPIARQVREAAEYFPEPYDPPAWAASSDSAARRSSP
jgi:transcriptional regulator GlxA family with amidase domain